jgi:hypothetical protein
MDDRRVHNQKHHTSDFEEDMEMSYIQIKKKKDKRMVEAPSLETKVKQTRPMNHNLYFIF